MNSNISQHQVIHLVAVPSTENTTKPLGRIAPGILCAQAIKSNMIPDGQIILIGGRTCDDQARKLGLENTIRFAPPLGQPNLIRRQIKLSTKSSQQIYCWNDELVSIIRGLPIERHLISTAPHLIPRGSISKQIKVRVLNDQDHIAWKNRGIECSVDRTLPLAIDRMNIEHLNENQNKNSLCIGVISDRPSDTDARELAFLMGLLNAAGHSLTGVVPSTSAHLPAAHRHHRGLQAKFKFVTISDPMCSWLHQFDLCIHPNYDGSGSSMLIERICKRAGVPVLRLKQSMREGLSRAPGVAGPIIEQLDQIRNSKSEPALV